MKIWFSFFLWKFRKLKKMEIFENLETFLFVISKFLNFQQKSRNFKKSNQSISKPWLFSIFKIFIISFLIFEIFKLEKSCDVFFQFLKFNGYAILQL